VVTQETRHFQEQTGDTRRGRSKEEATDYRYFPEPDLVPLEPSAETVARLREAMPELPAARTARFRGDYGLSAQDAADLNAAPAIADYFEAVAALGDDPKTAADWVRNQPAAVGTIPPAGIAGIVRLIGAGTITATIAKQVYALLEADPRADPAALVEEHGLASIGDTGELERMVDEVVAQNPQFVEQFRAGKEGVINALVGQVMKQTRGRADARQVQQLLRDRIAR